MKKIIFSLVSFCMMYATSNAQYCGHTGPGSGPTQCTPSGAMTKPGLSPTSDSLPPLINGMQSTTVIQFKNFDTIRFGGQLLTVQDLTLDSIGNLPRNVCWVTNKANNKWANQEDGCIKVNGTVCEDPGQYRLKIIVTANIGVPIQTDAGAAGLYYYVRVKNNGDADTPLDTTGQSTDSNIKVLYGNAKNCTSTIGIVDASSNLNSMNVVPNPFNNRAVVSFYADKAGVITESMTNMIGNEVMRRTSEVRMGENTSMIERNNLATGVYFYSISDGKSVLTKRVVIE